jgi:hypothetical protein
LENRIAIHDKTNRLTLDAYSREYAHMYIEIEFTAASRLAERLLIESKVEESYHELFLMMPRMA